MVDKRGTLDRIMPRHAPFRFSLALGVITLIPSLVWLPAYAVGLSSIALFITFLALTAIKLPYLTADYLQSHARDEDTPAPGIFLIVLIVVLASLVSLFLAVNSGQKPDAWEVTVSVASVLLGWFTVQALGAFHYAYEYYQASRGDEAEPDEPRGGLEFPGHERPDGTAFMYFSYTVGTSVATSDTKVTSNAMRRRVGVHLVFSHLFNTIILAAAVNVLMSLGSGG